MPANRNALIRYKTIDKCLQRRNRKWTLEDLIDACSDALYEYEGIDKGVSKRTVQSDIQTMRSDKLGYNAPIIVIDKKYYTYEDPNYSITNIPLSEQDLGLLSESIAMLKQFKGFSHFRELEGMVQKLEDHVYSQQSATNPVIDFEKNDNLKGLEYLDPIYQTIIKQEPIDITYQSFKARKASTFTFHPYLLKEFRNRWFVIGKRDREPTILNLALDRIIDIIPNEEVIYQLGDFDSESYFKNVIGVSVSNNVETQSVVLFVNHKHAPYILTKPLHHSQKVIQKDHYGVTISLDVQLNFELEKEILSYGEAVRVLAPNRLKRNIRERLENANENYQSELTDKGISVAFKRLAYKGLAIFHHTYTQREIRHISRQLNRFFQNKIPSQVDLLSLDKNLLNVVINKNITQIIRKKNKNLQLIQATYFDNAPIEQQHFNWHQSTQFTTYSSSLIVHLHLSDIDEKNGLQSFLLGSHKHIHTPQNIDLISENSFGFKQEASKGTAYIFSPLLLTKFEPARSPNRKIIRLAFASE
jgi:predicted DNA-binding transcriptional regulator YafY